MFQQVLIVVDRDTAAQTIQSARLFSQFHSSKFLLLHLETLENTPLLFSELDPQNLDRQKEWSKLDPAIRNVSASPTSTLICSTAKLKSKLKVVGTEPSVFNLLHQNSEAAPAQPQSLETAIADIALLCKADLVFVSLSQPHRIVYANLIRVTKSPVLIFK